ncbi:MAG: metallophosphoesterase [Eggerthellaceae bacterium]|nr:metallophosphoesterase [Eggerthellaceae bacterium]
MTLIGVISDTHGSLHAQAYAALADCDFIIHAGDICDPGIIRELETLAPVYAVLGNNDYDEYGPNVGRFSKPVIEGVRFLVAHYPNDVRVTPFGGKGVVAGEPIPNICIHGHTHIPRLEYGPDVRPVDFVLNPGSATLPRGGFQRSIAKIEIINTRVRSIRIETLSGKLIMGVEPDPINA